MKFLCVKCDSAMTLLGTQLFEDQGSIAVRYGCPDCQHEIAMLTNRAETQLVTSLGVKIGPAQGATSPQSASKCPFGAMVQGSAGASAPEPIAAPAATLSTNGVLWSAEANSRLERVPSVVRQMARMGIEQYARDNGYPEVTVSVLDEAKAQFGF